MILLYILALIIVGAIIESIAIRLLLGYSPARLECKNINGEIQIYHNGLSEKDICDEYEYSMNYYYVPPSWISWMFFTFDSKLDKNQARAIKCRNLKELN